MEFIEKMASSHKEEISVAEQDIKGWMKVCLPPLCRKLTQLSFTWCVISVTLLLF